MESLETPAEQSAAPEMPLETPAQLPGDFESLMQRHAQMERQQRQNPESLNTETLRAFVAELQALSQSVTGEQRETLEAAQRRWIAFLELRKAMASNRRGGIPVWALMLITVAGMLAISLGITWMLRRDATPTVSPTQISLADLTPTGTLPGGGITQLATPTLEILPTPTPVFQVLPTVTPIPTPETTPEPTTEVTVTVAPTVAPYTDPSGDIASLAGGQAVSDPPVGLDSISCNVGGDTLVLRDALPPFTVEGAGDATRLTVWLKLAEPPPAQRALTYHWILALDVDGNAGTGRPRGAGYINPDLGTEVGAGVLFYPDGRAEPYFYIWDSAQGDWASGTRVPDLLQVTFTENRDAIALSFPIAELSAAIQDISGVTLDAAQLRGRIGTIASSDTVASIVDFCPDLP
ncbi:MAG: hypothetical protein BWY63_00157 [Chloroflexi bacterium ADurb.Bin360]|nr:MAG: hypothetical protein BWY63_00157 [Chloroflexi bacterium ADurb.Bin360]